MLKSECTHYNFLDAPRRQSFVLFCDYIDIAKRLLCKHRCLPLSSTIVSTVKVKSEEYCNLYFLIRTHSSVCLLVRGQWRSSAQGDRLQVFIHGIRRPLSDGVFPWSFVVLSLLAPKKVTNARACLHSSATCKVCIVILSRRRPRASVLNSTFIPTIILTKSSFSALKCG